ncbi:MAG: hypothetical protein EBR09_14505 [Proteobacteria bacterium]|nr:hypothetical protein [Pseudomonadota bacterium]
MLFHHRSAIAFTFSFLAISAASCGPAAKTEDSKTQTVVGRGGVLFDSRIQIVNALTDAIEGSACIYLAEYESSFVPKLDYSQPLTQEQTEFLQRVELDSQPVNKHPVSILALDESLSQKDAERKLRGIISVPVGLSITYFGLLPLFIAVAWTGSAAALLHPVMLPYFAGTFGGLGILNQASRDLSNRNQGIRVDNAAFTNASPARIANLGVTMAFVNSARNLTPSSGRLCPRNLTAESVQPFANDIQQKFSAISDGDRAELSANALKALRNSGGCHFSAKSGNETIVYHAVRKGAEDKILNLTVYKIEHNKTLSKVAQSDMNLQLGSDGESGMKFISESHLGSMAVWVSPQSDGTPAHAKISHKLPSGEYADNRPFIEGTCKL